MLSDLKHIWAYKMPGEVTWRNWISCIKYSWACSDTFSNVSVKSERYHAWALSVIHRRELRKWLVGYLWSSSWILRTTSSRIFFSSKKSSYATCFNLSAQIIWSRRAAPYSSLQLCFSACFIDSVATCLSHDDFRTSTASSSCNWPPNPQLLSSNK